MLSPAVAVAIAIPASTAMLVAAGVLLRRLPQCHSTDLVSEQLAEPVGSQGLWQQLLAERARRQAAESALAQALQVAAAGLQAQQQLLEAERAQQEALVVQTQREAAAREQELQRRLEAELDGLQSVEAALAEARHAADAHQ